MVKRAISVIDGNVHLDPNIIGFRNKRDWKKIIETSQIMYNRLNDLDKVAIKLHEIFNWHVQEFYPAQESPERELFLLDLVKRKKRMK